MLRQQRARGSGYPPTGLKVFPLLTFDPGLSEDSHQQAAADVLSMRIWYPEPSSAPLHVLVIAAGHRRLEPQRTEKSDKVLGFDWTDRRHSGDFADLDAMAVDVWNRGVIGDAEQYPSL